jgi:MinD superfamily P-loop ATPase
MMKQIAIISGKGGTGKTTISAAIAALENKCVIADCDVDAADLYIILKPKILEKIEFKASKQAFIDMRKCKKCGRCVGICRFKAISDIFVIDPIGCEGCGLCYRICPFGAIVFREKTSGYYFVSQTAYGPLIHAELGIAEENSGKLVSLVRKKSREILNKKNLGFIIIDGSPGIGCPVIASITGVNLALVVTEPTLSGIHDLERIIGLTRHFNINTMVCINKYDINEENTRKIESICRQNNISIAGKIAYDKEVSSAMRKCQTIIDYMPNSQTAREIENIWEKLKVSLTRIEPAQ